MGRICRRWPDASGAACGRCGSIVTVGAIRMVAIPHPAPEGHGGYDERERRGCAVHVAATRESSESNGNRLAPVSVRKLAETFSGNLTPCPQDGNIVYLAPRRGRNVRSGSHDVVPAALLRQARDWRAGCDAVAKEWRGHGGIPVRAQAERRRTTWVRQVVAHSGPGGQSDPSQGTVSFVLILVEGRNVVGLLPVDLGHEPERVPLRGLHPNCLPYRTAHRTLPTACGSAVPPVLQLPGLPQGPVPRPDDALCVRCSCCAAWLDIGRSRSAVLHPYGMHEGEVVRIQILVAGILGQEGAHGVVGRQEVEGLLPDQVGGLAAQVWPGPSMWGLSSSQAVSISQGSW